MLEGIEPTVSTIPLGSTNKIVSGDRPSTASSDQTKHTISFSSECGWIPCEPLARDPSGCRDETHHSIPYSSILYLPPSHPTHRFFHYERYISLLRQVKYSCDTSSFTLSRGLVLPLWSLILISAPSHRQSTFELCELLVFLSRTHNASKLCWWLGGNVQRIKHSLFYTAKFLTLCTPSSFFWVKGF